MMRGIGARARGRDAGITRASPQDVKKRNRKRLRKLTRKARKAANRNRTGGALRSVALVTTAIAAGAVGANAKRLSIYARRLTGRARGRVNAWLQAAGSDGMDATGSSPSSASREARALP
jgi:hypothetical protein